MNAKKNVSERELQAQLDRWVAKIDELEAKARQSEASTRAQYLGQIQDLRERQARAEAKLKELRHAAQDARSGLVDGIEKMWEEFEGAVDSTVTKLKSALSKDGK